MKRFLLIMTAAALVLTICGMAKANDRNGHRFDDRRIDRDRDDFRRFDPRPFDFDRDDFRRFDPRRFDFDGNDFRRFDPRRFLC